MRNCNLCCAAFASAILVAGCCGTKTPLPREAPATVDSAPAPEAPEPPLIPRTLLFGNPDKSAARLSPDGAFISYLAPVEGVLNVFVAPADDLAAARPVTVDRDRGVRVYFWAYTARHLIYLQDQKGDENWHVYVVDLEKEETRDLTPVEGVHAAVEAVSPDFPDEILVGLNDRSPELHDIYRINIITGARTLVQENPGFAGFITDDQYRVRFGMKMTDDGGSLLLKPEAPSKTKKKKRKAKKGKKPAEPADGDPLPEGWETFMEIPMEDSLTTSPIDFDKQGRVLYLLDSRGRDTAAFTTLHLDSGELEVVAEDPRADLEDLMIHPTEKTVQAVAFTYARKEWRILDDGIAADFEALKKVADGDVEVVSRTLKDDRWIAAYVLDDGPIRYYLYDRESGTARFLFTNREALEGQPLVKMHPELIGSRDGLTLVSYLSLPPGSDPDGDGRPDAPVPLVLDVHGGPWARDSWGYNATHQWLANRGYAVLSVNFRGSTGFGKAFINKANLEWAGTMHNDLIDAVQWAVDQGIAPPDKVAIMGGSYGGYATLVGLTFTPETFACGVDIVGPSNLITLLETIPPYWAPMLELFTQRVGDHRTEAGKALLTERSPLTRAERIIRPLLIAQGANDPRVKQAESDQIVHAMQQKQIPVTYVLYPDEGHGFARPENRLSFYAVTESFLKECLGEEAEPIGDDFRGASITVPAGVEVVPGLSEALAATQKGASPR